MSGPAALDIAAPLIRSRRSLRGFESHRLARVALVDPTTGDVIDDALCAVLRAPRSYTGEDTVEISCHGGLALARMVLERLIAQGARVAEPGEFTRRAYLNGRLDLAQAEAVALLIGARTERAVALSARAVSGGISGPLRSVRQRLVEIMAALEAALDFPEDVPPEPHDNVLQEINSLYADTTSILNAARRGAVAHTGVTVAIVGAPNAGKSSLFNALAGKERSIVTPKAGTTRDVVEASIAICGVPVQLLDTAGIADPTDDIDAEGMRRARQAVSDSDIVVALVDGDEWHSTGRWCVPEGCSTKPHVVAVSKADLWRLDGSAAPSRCALPRGAVAVSVRTAGGIDDILSALGLEVERLSGTITEEGAIAASVRQIDLLGELSESLGRAADLVRRLPHEIVVVELRTALDATSSLLGIEIGDAILDAVFARFCVGK